MHVQNATVANNGKVEKTAFQHGEAIHVNVTCVAQKMVRGAELRMVLRDGRGITVFTADGELGSLSPESKSFAVTFIIPANTLRPNSYSLTFALFVPNLTIIEMVEDAVFFSVFDSGSKYAQSEGLDYGLVFSPCTTEVRQVR